MLLNGQAYEIGDLIKVDETHLVGTISGGVSAFSTPGISFVLAGDLGLIVGQNRWISTSGNEHVLPPKWTNLSS